MNKISTFRVNQREILAIVSIKRRLEFRSFPFNLLLLGKTALQAWSVLD